LGEGINAVQLLYAIVQLATVEIVALGCLQNATPHRPGTGSHYRRHTHHDIGAIYDTERSIGAIVPPGAYQRLSTIRRIGIATLS
jgi:hypothetical protein